MSSTGPAAIGLRARWPSGATICAKVELNTMTSPSVGGSNCRRWATISLAAEFRCAFRICRHLSVEISNGFSTRTWMPAFSAGTANSACRHSGVAR